VRDPSEEAECLLAAWDVAAWDVAAWPPDAEPPTEAFSEGPSLREEAPSCEPLPCEDLSEGPSLREEAPSCEPLPCASCRSWKLAGEDVVGKCDGSLARASAHPTASGTAHRPMTAALRAVVAPLDRKVAMVSRHTLLRGASRSCLRESNGRATRLDVQLDVIHEGRHKGQPSPVFGAHRAVQDGHHECPTVADRKRQAVSIGDDTQMDQSMLVGGAVANGVCDRLVDGTDEVVAVVGIESKRRRLIGGVLPRGAQFRTQGWQAQLAFSEIRSVLARSLHFNQPERAPRLPRRASDAV
jgi:hypothetical protein